MSIIATKDFNLAIGQGYDDPGHPIGVWECATSVTGDGSGGTRSVQLNLKGAGVQIGNMFSLEEIWASDSDVTATDALFMSTTGFQGFGTTRSIAIPMLVLDSETSLNAEPRQYKLFIGRGGTPGTAAPLTFQKANANTEVLAVACRGYIWTPRSVGAPGGPRRPPDGPFSQ